MPQYLTSAESGGPAVPAGSRPCCAAQQVLMASAAPDSAVCCDAPFCCSSHCGAASVWGSGCEAASNAAAFLCSCHQKRYVQFSLYEYPLFDIALRYGSSVILLCRRVSTCGAGSVGMATAISTGMHSKR